MQKITHEHTITHWATLLRVENHQFELNSERKFGVTWLDSRCQNNKKKNLRCQSKNQKISPRQVTGNKILTQLLYRAERSTEETNEYDEEERVFYRGKER